MQFIAKNNLTKYKQTETTSYVKWQLLVNSIVLITA